MAAGKGTKRGLGRGLDALFGEVSINPDDVLDEEGELIQSETEPDESDKPGRSGKEAGKQKKPTGGKKTAGKTENKEKEADEADRIRFLDIHKLAPNKDQPRKEFDKEKITELADSIREHGVIQPIMVRKAENGYEIVAGERRWRASMEAGLKKVPCLVRELTPEQNMVVALIENIQREDLNAIEEAEALNKMIVTYGLTQEQVSKSVGRSRPYIANALRLLKLPDAVRKMVSDGSLSAGHAKAILSMEGEEKQIQAAILARDNGWSVREMEVFAGKSKKPGSESFKKKKNSKEKNQAVLTIEEELQEIFGTRVNLVVGPKKGRIEIEYYSREELDRLIEILENLKNR